MCIKSWKKISLAGCVLLALVSVPLVPAFAQTQAQQNRLNRVAQFVVTSPMCARLGMQLDSDLPTKAGAAFEAETDSWKIELTTLERLTREAISRQSAIFKTDLQTAADEADTEAELRGLRATLLQYGQTCIAATADSIFSKLIITPANYDLEKAATDAADAMLEAGGLASWQTPNIQARGDLIMLAGSCRSKIGALRSDALVAEFGQSEDARVRDYYSKSFDEGLSNPSLISTLSGCDTAIKTNREKLK